MRRRPLLVLVTVAVASLPSLAGTPASSQVPPPVPLEVTSQQLTPPVTGADTFAEAFSLDEGRAVVRSVVGGTPVVEVYDRDPGGEWSHAATIAASADATTSWALALAVSGDTIAVADPAYLEDPGNFGRVHVFDRGPGGWAEVQTIQLDRDFSGFASGVWLAGDVLVVSEGSICDGSCSSGNWYLYERGAGDVFSLVFATRFTRSSRFLTAAVDGDRIAVATPGATDPFLCNQSGSWIEVWNAATDPAERVFDEEVPPDPNPTCDDVPADSFRRVALGGGTFAYESCCVTRNDLSVLRESSTGYESEAVLSIDEISGGLFALPDVLLRLDTDDRTLRSMVRAAGAWSTGVDVPLPPGAVLPPLGPLARSGSPVAAGDTLAIRGDGVLHLLRIRPAVPRCLGFPATVDLGAGDAPTAGDDIIVGTAGSDTISAGQGNDLVCAGDGDDVVVGGAGNDIVLGEDGDDRAEGRLGTDLLSGGGGADILMGGGDADWLFGGDDNDVVRGGTGDDLIRGDNGFDRCVGGLGTDNVDTCEVVAS